MLDFINTPLYGMCSSFTLDDKKYENESMLPNNASNPEQVQLRILFVESNSIKPHFTQ